MEADSGRDFAEEKPESHSPEKHEKKKKRKKIEGTSLTEAVTGDDLTATQVVEEAPPSSKSGDKKSKKRKKVYHVAVVGENGAAETSGTRNRDGSDDTKDTESVTPEEPIMDEKKMSNALTANMKNGVEEAPSVTKSSHKKSKKRDREKVVMVGGENGTAIVSESGKEHVSNVKDVSATTSNDKKRNKRKQENNVSGGGENSNVEMETAKDGDSYDSPTSKRMSRENGKKGKDVVSGGPGHGGGNGAAEMAGDVKEGASVDSIKNDKNNTGIHLDVVVEAPSSSKSNDKKSRKRKKENDVLAGGDNSTTKISEEVLDDSIIMKPGPKKKRNKEKDVGVGGSGHLRENGTDEGDSDDSAASKPRLKKKQNKGKDAAAVGTETEMSNASKLGASDNSQNANPRTKKPSKPRKRVSFAGEVEVFDDKGKVFDDKGKSFRPEEDDDPLVQGRWFTPEEDGIIKEAVRKYIEGNQLGKEGLQMVLHNNKHSQLRGCWKEIGASLPWRPSEAVYFRAHTLFERSEARKWQPHEYETLKRLHEQFGPDWKLIGAELGKHRIHVKDTWRWLGMVNRKRGNWSQEEYQSLFDLVNLDLAMKAFDVKKTKHGTLRDNISWDAISTKLSTRSHSACCNKWYRQLSSALVSQGLWLDTDDYRLLDAARFERAEFSLSSARKPPRDATDVPYSVLDDATRCCTANAGSFDHSASVHLFVDAAFSDARCTYAFILVDAMGNFLFAQSGNILASSAFQAELVGILEALKFITKCCYTAISLFTDSMLAVKYLHSHQSSWPWDNAFNLHQCTQLWFQDSTYISHTPRQFNMIAHILAQTSDLSANFREFHSIPESLQAFF